MSDLLGIHSFEQLLSLLLVELHQHVGLHLAVRDQLEEPFGLLQVEALKEFGDVGGVHSLDLTEALLSVPLVGKLFDALYVFSGIFFHRVEFF